MMNRADPVEPQGKPDASMPWYAWPIGVGGFLIILYSLMKAVTDSILPEELERRAEKPEPRALDHLQEALNLPPEQRGLSIPSQMTGEPSAEAVEEMVAQMREAESGAFGSLDQETLQQVAREIVLLKDCGALADVLVEGRVPNEVVTGLVRNMAFEGPKYRQLQERLEERRRESERRGPLERLSSRGGR